jgi:hypothetical protein
MRVELYGRLNQLRLRRPKRGAGDAAVCAVRFTTVSTSFGFRGQNGAPVMRGALFLHAEGVQQHSPASRGLPSAPWEHLFGFGGQNGALVMRQYAG